MIFPLVRAQQPTSRTEQMEQIRTDKRARLWPENTPGLVKRLNTYAQRGLLEGARSGEGVNGPQIVLGGMRSGNGTSFGVGYRRIDSWNDGWSFGLRPEAHQNWLTCLIFRSNLPA